MPKVVGNAAGVLPIVGELKTHRVSQHVRMDRKGEFCRLSGALDHAEEPRRGYRCALFGHEYIGAGTPLEGS